MAMFLRTLVIATAAVVVFVNVAMASNYNVAAPDGWNLNTQLQAWANNNTFRVGDTLTFVYGRNHSVLEVKLPDYDACLTNASISSDASGNTVIALNSIGNRYFICGTPTHCNLGMKVAITTVAAPAPPPGAPTVPPAAAPSSPTPATTPSPASPSGSPSASPVESPAPKTAAPTTTPKTSPSISPSKSPASSPPKSPKSPASSPATSPPAPPAESPASPPSVSTPPSSANKLNMITGFTTGMGFIIMTLLTL